jgi:hypothetical protein
MVTNNQMDDPLWEIAKDFDNDDPLIYDHLIEKIRQKKFAIQA